MRYLYVFILILFGSPIFSQSKLPVIKATSKKVAINDGGYLDRDAWSLSPKIKPDVFTADRTRKQKWVTFYTDIDSIKVKVKPGTRFNFVVLLNGTDSCYTQIASAIPPESKVKSRVITNDTIPFTLTAYNAIAVRAVVNNMDTVSLHFDAGSFDFRLTRDAVLKKTTLLSNQPGALTGKTTPDFNHINKIFKIQMGSLVWNNPETVITGITAHEMDGRFGWNLFEGKQLEINYDKNILVVHSNLPKALKGYVRSDISFIRSFVCINGSFEIANKTYAGKFLMDTGSDQAMILDSSWVSRNNFPTNLKLIRTSVLRDPRGVKYETRIVLSPLIRINSFACTNIPTLLLGSNNPVGFEINYLGNDLLKRFNIIFDFKNDQIYMKPNKLTGLKYRENS